MFAIFCVLCVYANFCLSIFYLNSHSFTFRLLIYIVCVFARSADTFMLIVEKVKILRHWPLNDVVVDDTRCSPVNHSILFRSVPCQYNQNQTIYVLGYCNKATSDLLLFTFVFFFYSFVGLMLDILVRENVTQFTWQRSKNTFIYECVCVYMALALRVRATAIEIDKNRFSSFSVSFI